MSDDYKNVEIPEKNNQEEFSIEDYLYILNRKKWYLIIIAIAVLVLGMLYTNSKERIYASVCEIYTNQDTKKSVFNSDELMAIASLGNMSSNSLEMVSKLITNSTNLEIAFNELTAEEREKGFDNKIPKSVSVEEIEQKSNIYGITVKSKDPNASCDFANNLARIYFEEEAENYNKYSNRAQDQIKEEIDKILVEIDTVRDKMVNLKQKTGIYNIESDINSKVSNKYTIEEKINSTKIEIASLQEKIAKSIAILNSIPKTSKTNTQTSISTVAKITERIDELTTERENLLQKFTPESPEVKEVNRKIAFETGKLKDAERNSTPSVAHTYKIVDNTDLIIEQQTKIDNLRIELEGKKVSLAKLTDLLMNTNENLKNVPIDESELAKVTEQYEILKSNLGLLQSNYYRLAFNSQSDYNIGRVISNAVVNPVPVEPNIPKSFVIFLIVGLVLGSFVALLADNVDNIVYDDKTMKKITSLPCLSKIPFINTSGRLQIGKLTGHSNFLEAFRIFRNNIMLNEIMSESQGIDKNKVFAVTGPDAKQGKSTTSANLAIAMSLDGNKVLLVDADLRKPNIAKFFNVPNDVGYTTLVKGTTNIEESIKSSNVDGLDLLTSGPLPPNPSEFLNSDANRQVVKQLSNLYDVVIFDTSPCTFISDTQIVTTFVDAVILVITVKTTRIPIVRQALEQLNLVKAPIIGYVLNKVQTNNKRKGYYYNYYYYASDDKD